MSARDELLRIYERDGNLTAEKVVEEASDPASPLHATFVWDDTEAARRYRLAQATTLIIQCRVTIQTAPDRVVRTRAFVHTDAIGDHPAGYSPVEEAMADDRREVVIRQAQRELAAFLRKYKDLVDVGDLFRAVMQEQAAA